MKANFIIGKKQIILASLVVVLGVAVYLNWSFANSNDQLDVTKTLDDSSQSVLVDEAGMDIPSDETGEVNGNIAVNMPVDDSKNAADANVSEDKSIIDKVSASLNGEKADAADVNSKSNDKKMGDALLVNAKVVADDTYFAKAKLARTKSRDESIQTISTLLDSEKLTEVDKKQASDKALALTDIIETESKIENLIKAKGFTDCMVYIGENNQSANIVVKTEGLDQNQATQIKNIIVTEGGIRGENVSISEVR